MRNYLTRLMMYACIAMVPISCGTRKVNLDKESVSISESVKNEQDEERKTVKVINTQSEAFNQTDKSNETTETTETSKFDKYTGKQTEYSKTTKTGKEIDRSINTTKTVTNNTLHEVEKLRTLTITKHTYDADSKKKAASTNRNGLYYLGGFGLLILGVLAWLKWVR